MTYKQLKDSNKAISIQEMAKIRGLFGSILSNTASKQLKQSLISNSLKKCWDIKNKQNRKRLALYLIKAKVSL